MTILLLKFAINLERFDHEFILRNHGPLFHRWLPDGQRDSIAFDTGDPNSSLRVWFERRGYVDGHFIRFDYKRTEVDLDIMNRQAVLDAGPLRGQLEIREIDDREIRPVRDGITGDTAYVALGKRIVLDLLYPPVSRLISLLRINFGQYWINELERWDSRKSTLGGYCQRIHLHWSLDSGATWAPFIPDEPIFYETMTVIMDRAFRDYITEDDWRQLEDILHEGYEPSLAAIILSRTHELLDQGDMKSALIEGTTALEIAIKDFLRAKLGGNAYLISEMQSFWTLPLIAQLISLASTIERVSLGDIERATRALKIRHQVVHEGKNPPDEARQQLSGLLRTIAALIEGPTIRFPESNTGNSIRSPEQWLESNQRG